MDSHSHPHPTTDQLPSDEAAFRALVGRHGDYYLGIRRRMQTTRNELVWNWWAFLLNIAWFLSKRMWGAAIVVGVSYALFFAVITEYVLTGILVPSWASPQATLTAIALLYVGLIIGVPLFCGMFGNKLYVTYINARVKAMTARSESEGGAEAAD